VERVVVLVERTAGVFLALVALLVFASVVSRDLLGFDIPDSFDFSRYLQGIAIFWGIAVATYRNAHILVDLVWELSGERAKRWIDLFATVATLSFLAAMAWMLVERLPSVVRAHQLTSDMKLPVWPFYALATVGAVAAALVGAIRLARLVRGETIDR
jgi:TRAP-type C4-dicarboxylate transport system permease small subunit